MKDKTRLVIGIVSYPTYDDENYYIVAVYNDYKKMVIERGYIPLVIPHIQNVDLVNTKTIDIPELTEEEKNIYRNMIDMCDGIILPGGNRIYEYNKFIASYAIEKDIPVLGTCLGMQTLACFDNYDRCLEENHDASHKQRGVKYVHNVKVVRNTLLSSILGKEEIMVNSVHQQHVNHVNNFIVNAYSHDGLIEGIELPGKQFVLGIQWHPEKMYEFDTYAKKILDAFFLASRKQRLLTNFQKGEPVEVYDENKNPTGRIKLRHKDKFEPGECIIGVQAVIINSKGEILISQRADFAPLSPSEWECNGGAKGAYETLPDALEREMYEELGLKIDKNKAKHLKSCKNGCIFKEIYTLRMDIPIEEIKFKDGEAQAAKWVTIDEFMDMFNKGEIVKNVNIDRSDYERCLELLSK